MRNHTYGPVATLYLMESIKEWDPGECVITKNDAIAMSSNSIPDGRICKGMTDVIELEIKILMERSLRNHNRMQAMIKPT